MASGVTPLVGRDHELGLLLDRWDLAKEGEGQVVLLSGEPGDREIAHRPRACTSGSRPSLIAAALLLLAATTSTARSFQ